MGVKERGCACEREEQGLKETERRVKATSVRLQYLYFSASFCILSVGTYLANGMGA